MREDLTEGATIALHDLPKVDREAVPLVSKPIPDRIAKASPYTVRYIMGPSQVDSTLVHGRSPANCLHILPWQDKGAINALPSGFGGAPKFVASPIGRADLDVEDLASRWAQIHGYRGETPTAR